MGDPKSKRSSRQVALSVATKQLLQEWIQQPKLSQGDDWLFPSENGTQTDLTRQCLAAGTLLKIRAAWTWLVDFPSDAKNFRHAVERSGSGRPYPVSADGQHG